MAPDSSGQPRLALRNARILAMDGSPPFLGCVEIVGERISGLRPGPDPSPAADREPESLDCGGRLLLPGFIDAHIHVLAAARALAGVDCSPAITPSIDAIQERLQEAARDLPPGAWLRARGYHETMLAELRQPTRRDLDRAVADHPLRLVHASGHASVLNSAALRALGISASSEEPAGARIEREIETGEPNGVVIEMEDWLDRRTPRLDRAALAALVEHLSDRLLSAGVTAVQDLGHRNDSGRAALFSALVAECRFRPRLTLATGYAAFAAADSAEAAGVLPGPVKIMLNEIGERLSPSPERLTEMVGAIHRAERQVAIHAVEQGAIAAAADAIEAALRRNPRAEHRHRIEHASILSPTLQAHLADLDVVVVSNPGFLHESGERYLRTIPAAELGWLYDVAGLGSCGVRVAAGSDAPVAAAEPLRGVVAASTRRSLAGTRLPGSPLPLERALELFTSSAAYAGFQEREMGQIAAGCRADLVLLDGDSSDPATLRPALTVLGGRVVWRRADWEPVPHGSRQQPTGSGGRYGSVSNAR